MDSKPMAYLYVCVCVCVCTHTGSNMSIFIDLKPSLCLVSEADMQ